MVTNTETRPGGCLRSRVSGLLCHLYFLVPENEEVEGETDEWCPDESAEKQRPGRGGAPDTSLFDHLVDEIEGGCERDPGAEKAEY